MDKIYIETNVDRWMEWMYHCEDVNETDDQLFVSSMLELPLYMRVRFTCDAHRDSLVRIAEAMHDYEDQGRDWDDEDPNQ